MVFSSYPFILFFLPAVVLILAVLRGARSELPVLFLAAASVVFYAYWDWRFVWVILASIVVNYMFGLMLDRVVGPPVKKKFTLGVGVAINLAFLGYFKYTNFFIENANAIFGTSSQVFDVVLPLGISFFTFQQIAYLVDVYRGNTIEHSFHHYLLFVSFFPQLIAGPIVHHREMMPQFVAGRAGRLSAPWFAQGMSIFAIGLVKKVLIADKMAEFATPVFDASAAGIPIPLLEAWGGALAYTFQIYFDFSAYSDMAVGLGLMFGLRLPINFNSPYKAANLIEFWQRWHMTLSRFLRDYLYIPLGGNRRGTWRRYVNLMAVMLLGGLWHGANWTFVLWGGLHGLGLVANRLWRWVRGTDARDGRPPSLAGRWLGRCITFLFVVVTWVFFRAEELPSATNILGGMVGVNGAVLPKTYYAYLGSLAPTLADAGVRFEAGYLFLGIVEVAWLTGLLAIVWLLPNVMEWAGYRQEGEATTKPAVLPRYVAWQPSVTWSLVLSGLTVVSLFYMSRTGEFLYFQF